MPTNPTSPQTSGAVERLSLGVASAREADVQAQLTCQAACGSCFMCSCFDASASAVVMCQTSGYCSCFDGEASSLYGGPPGMCFESE